MARWVAICGDCYAEELPGSYFPDGMEFETCSNCGQDAMCAHINPRELERNGE
jgi:NMD protein affecting ribosome stability and mRNA decay